jgi:CDGSH-type Zn-finger protein
MEKNEEKVKVQFAENGPIIVSGVFKQTGQYGEKENEGSTVYLCRCGQSKNKPYCDGTHKTIGFKG